MYFAFCLPDLKAPTIRSYAERAKAYLHRIGISASLELIDGSTDLLLLKHLPPKNLRGNFLVFDSDSDACLRYGWNYKRWKSDVEPEIISFDYEVDFIGAI